MNIINIIRHINVTDYIINIVDTYQYIILGLIVASELIISLELTYHIGINYSIGINISYRD